MEFGPIFSTYAVIVWHEIYNAIFVVEVGEALKLSSLERNLEFAQ